LALELTDTSDHAEQRLLCEVRGLGGRQHHADRDRVDPALVPSQQSLERGAVAVARLQGKGNVPAVGVVGRTERAFVLQRHLSDPDMSAPLLGLRTRPLHVALDDATAETRDQSLGNVRERLFEDGFLRRHVVRVEVLAPR
jgi:hypothetical protein